MTFLLHSCPCVDSKRIKCILQSFSFLQQIHVLRVFLDVLVHTQLLVKITLKIHLENCFPSVDTLNALEPTADSGHNSKFVTQMYFRAQSFIKSAERSFIVLFASWSPLLLHVSLLGHKQRKWRKTATYLASKTMTVKGKSFHQNSVNRNDC